MEQVKVTLAPEEYSGLVRLCETELRSVPDQMRHILRRELQRRKLLALKGRQHGEAKGQEVKV